MGDIDIGFFEGSTKNIPTPSCRGHLAGSPYTTKGPPARTPLRAVQVSCSSNSDKVAVDTADLGHRPRSSIPEVGAPGRVHPLRLGTPGPCEGGFLASGRPLAKELRVLVFQFPQIGSVCSSAMLTLRVGSFRNDRTGIRPEVLRTGKPWRPELDLWTDLTCL